jgi:hypothetical protein
MKQGGEEQTGTSTSGTKSEGRQKRRSGNKENFQSAMEDTRRSVDHIASDLRERIEQNPFRALGIAVGAGYLLGGGLFSALTARLVLSSVRIGMRLAAVPVVRNEIFSFMDALSSERGGRESEGRNQ